MDFSSIVNILPFWILGVPLAIAIISHIRMPRQADLTPPDRRSQRESLTSDAGSRSGETSIPRG
jgi:hypothetical protein